MKEVQSNHKMAPIYHQTLISHHLNTASLIIVSLVHKKVPAPDSHASVDHLYESDQRGVVLEVRVMITHGKQDISLWAAVDCFLWLRLLYLV